MPTALITGATGGIGAKISRILAEHKYRLILLSKSMDDLKALSDELSSGYGANTRIISCDVSNYEELKKEFSDMKDLDVLINCAGISGPVGLFEDNDLAGWENAIKINLYGTAYTCQLLIPLLSKSPSKSTGNSKRGKIINFAGGGSAYPRRLHSAYATSKTAVVRFTETLALEYPDIDINVISPGPHKTKMWDEQLHEKEPDHWADPIRLKKFILYLSSEDSDNVSGKFIHLNDDWDKKDFTKLNIDMFALRRIDDPLLKKLENKNKIQ